MHAFAYISQASGALDELNVPALLEDARAFNTEHGLTGLLLYTNGKFMQMLEGPAEAMIHARSRIQGSGRHSNITVLQDEPITQRLFQDWVMAAQHDTDLGEVRRWVEGRLEGVPEQLTPTQHDVLRMMRGFLDWERYAGTA